MPTTSILLQSIHSGSSGMLEIRTVESIGPHYAKTLRSWRENFQANWERDIKPRLLQQKMDDGKRGADGASQAERQKKLEWKLGVLKRKWEVRFSLFRFCVSKNSKIATVGQCTANNFLIYSITFRTVSLASARVSWVMS